GASDQVLVQADRGVVEDDVGWVVRSKQLGPQQVDRRTRRDLFAGASLQVTFLQQQQDRRGGEEQCERGGARSQPGDVSAGSGASGQPRRASGGCLAGVGSLAEQEQVVALRNLDDDRLASAFRGEVLLKPLPQLGGVDADDVVGAGVVVGRPAEDVMADLLFMDVGHVSGESPVGEVEEQVTESVGLADDWARGDSLDEELQLRLPVVSEDGAVHVVLLACSSGPACRALSRDRNSAEFDGFCRIIVSDSVLSRAKNARREPVYTVRTP